MSFRTSAEEKRWLVINNYIELSRKDPNVKISKIYNNLKFKEHHYLNKMFVSRTIQRCKETNAASDRQRNVKKRKIDEAVVRSVVKQATNKKKPKHQRSSRKNSHILHGSPRKKLKISQTSVIRILKSSGKK